MIDLIKYIPIDILTRYLENKGYTFDIGKSCYIMYNQFMELLLNESCFLNFKYLLFKEVLSYEF